MQQAKRFIIQNRSLTTDLEDTEKKLAQLTSNFTTGVTLPSHEKRKLTFGQYTADLIARWAGSWTFILIFISILIIWMIINSYYWSNYQSGRPFDPFPFILLNLILSCLAALQAPVILMSQNRGAERDRLHAEYDYKVNRKAEKEIRDLKRQLLRIEKKLSEK